MAERTGRKTLQAISLGSQGSVIFFFCSLPRLCQEIFAAARVRQLDGAQCAELVARWFELHRIATEECPWNADKVTSSGLEKAFATGSGTVGCEKQPHRWFTSEWLGCAQPKWMATVLSLLVLPVLMQSLLCLTASAFPRVTRDTLCRKKWCW